MKGNLLLVLTNLIYGISQTYTGSSAPLGYFDPLELSKDITEKDFKKYRESELKHGRIAMLAVVGVFFNEVFPFLLGNKITGPAIYQFQQADNVLQGFTVNVVGLCAAVEGFNIVKGWAPVEETFKADVGIAGLRSDYEPGDLSFDPLGWKPTSAAALTAVKTKELNNGRLAMIAIAGIVAQELATGAKVF